MTHQRHPDHRAYSAAAAQRADRLTHIELTWIEKRYEHWIRFGRIASERIVSRSTRIVAFRPGTTFAFVRWMSNDYGTIQSSIAIITAIAPGEPYTTFPFIRPGGELLLHIEGWPKVAKVLEAIDAVDATGVDPCDASPDHWRHVGNRIAAGLPFRPYSADRHAAWLRRKALEA